MKKILIFTFAILTLLTTSALAQQTVVQTSTISFAASPDQNTTVNGTPIVGSYSLKVTPSPGSTTVFTRNFGKPTPDGSNNIITPFGWSAAELAAIAAGNYTVTVTTIGPGGSIDSVPSDVFIVPSGGSTPINVALASAGGTAVASSVYSTNFPITKTNDGDRAGVPAGSINGYWNDGTQDNWPDWVEIDFNGTKTINEIDVFTLQDNYTSPITPTPTMTFSLYGITNFDVQYWNGSAWVTVASAVNNNLVWRKFTFTPVNTTKIRVFVNAGLVSWSRITEIEAWTN